MNTESKGARDFIAIIMVGAGSSHARGRIRRTAFARVKKIAVSDWSKPLFDLSRARRPP
jgi:fructoselysine-6-P-deglycase FrlB-like protein